MSIDQEEQRGVYCWQSGRNIILEKEQELSNLEISKNQLLQEKLKQQLELKNRELASKAMHLLNKNEIVYSCYLSRVQQFLLR